MGGAGHIVLHHGHLLLVRLKGGGFVFLSRSQSMKLDFVYQVHRKSITVSALKIALFALPLYPTHGGEGGPNETSTTFRHYGLAQKKMNPWLFPFVCLPRWVWRYIASF